MSMFENVNVPTTGKGIDKDKLMMMAMMGGMGGKATDDGTMGMNPMMIMMMAMMGEGDGNRNGFTGVTENPFLKNMLPTEIENAGMSYDGTIVLNGNAVKFDEDFNASITTTEGMEIAMPLLAVPTSMEQLTQGDIVVIDGEYVAIKYVNGDKNSIHGLTINKGEKTTRIISKSMFGTQNIKKVFNPFGSTGQMDPMMAMMLV